MPSKGITPILCLSVFGTIIGTSFVMGFSLAVVNNPAPVIKNSFSEIHLSRTGSAFTSSELSWFWYVCVAALPLLAPLGCYSGSRAARKFGRKKTLLANSSLLILSAALQAVSKPAKSYEMFLLGRLIIGCQIGIGSTVAPMYVSEVSPIDYRGAFGALFAWFHVFGQLVSSVLGFGSMLGNENLWPHLFTVLLICALIQILVLSFCPESPRFLLIDKNDRQAAVLSLERLRGIDFSVDKEIQHLITEFDATKNLPEIPYSHYFRHRELRQPLMIAFTAQSCIQFSAIGPIIYYSQPILEATLSGHGHNNPETSRYVVALLTVTRLIISTLAVLLVDKLGRRKCLLSSLVCLILCNTILGFLLSDVSTYGQSCNGIPNGPSAKIAILVIFFVHSMAIAFGVNSTSWIITPELFRTNARPKALFMATTLFWTESFMIALLFDYIEKAICGWVFLIFSAMLLLFFLYMFFKMPVLDRKQVHEIALGFEKRTGTE